MDGKILKPLDKCRICPNYESIQIYKHYVLKHFWDGLTEELDEFFPNGYHECFKCDNYTKDTLDDAIFHIGIDHKKVDDYLKDLKVKTFYTKTIKTSEDVDSDASDDIGVLEQKCESCEKNVAQIHILEGKHLCDQCVADKNRIAKRNDLIKSVLKKRPQVLVGISKNSPIPVVKLERVKIPVELSCNNMEVDDEVKVKDEVIDVSDSASIISEEVMIVNISNDYHNKNPKSSENKELLKPPKIEKVTAASTDNEIKTEPIEKNTTDLVDSGKENLLTKANQIKQENNDNFALSSSEQNYESKEGEMFRIKNSLAKDLLSNAGEQASSAIYPDVSISRKSHQQIKMDAIKTEPTEFNSEIGTNLKSEAIEILQSWIQDHQGQSPSKKEKEILANQTSLSVSQVDNWFVKARITKSNPQVPKNQIQDQKSNGFNVSQFHVKNSACVNVNKIESLQGKGATADPDDFISRKTYHQNIPVKVENMNDDDKNNAVQDNQVSSTGQNNSPPSEFFKEDSLDDLDLTFPFDIVGENDINKIEITNSVTPQQQKQEISFSQNMDQETYTCGLCENNVQTVMDLQKYFLHLIFIHHSNSLCQYLEINPQESKTHKCSQCQKQCHGHQAYLVHYFMGHEKQFLLDLQAKEVQKKKSSEADDQKRCPICQFFFPNEEALNIHIKAKHEIDKKCEICNSEQKFTTAGFEQHLLFEHFKHVHDQINSLSFPYNCNRCNVPLQDFQEALDHVVVQHHVLKQLYVNELLKQKKEEHYECIVCKNKHRKLVKFDKVEELRSHLAVDHFKELYFNDLKNKHEAFPICPFKDCPSMFNNKKLVEEHYKVVHKESILDWPNSNFINKCQMCFQGPFPTFVHLLKHLGVKHAESVERHVKRIGLQSTLLPVKKSIPAQNLNGVSNDQANVVKQTSVLKSSNQSSTNGSAHQKVQAGQSILIKSENSLSTAMVTSTSPLNPSAASMSSLKSFRKQTLKPRQLLEENVFREPTDNDRRDCILRIRSDPLCVVCHKRVWYETESTNNRLILMYRHIFRHHLAEEMKFDFLNAQLRKGVKNLLQCPICPELKPDYGSAADHYAVIHQKSSGPLWQLIHFGTTSITKALDGLEKMEMPDVELAQYSKDTLQQDFTKLNMAQAVKFMKIPLNSTLIQPAPCFQLNGLEECHECWNVKKGRGQINSVCQFEGFRKVKRVKCAYNIAFKFDACGFLDPYTDCSESDKELWTKSKENTKLDKENAKIILLRAGDEFCNMAKTENDLITKYKTEIGASVIWKRLQPKVREMCDVCYTSLFNAHFTCTDCGIIVCIDCHQVRLRGNLQYTGNSSNYKSKKRKIRNDLDAHYWPFCKGLNNVHQAEKLIPTQIVCGDIMQEMAKNVHETKRKLGLKLDCDCCKVSKTPSSSVIELANKNNVYKLCKEKAESPEKNTTLMEKSPKSSFVSQLEFCPLSHCKQQFRQNPEQHLPNMTHLTLHFHKEFSQLLPQNAPFKCPHCREERVDQMALMLHFGLDHGELEKQVKNYKQKMYSIKNMSLKVDKEESCKICGMNYHQHMMHGHGTIRTHLYTHFGPDLNKMVIETPEGKFKCPEPGCGYEKAEKGNFRDHLGVFHKYLDVFVDQYTPPPKKKLSLKDYNKQRKNSGPERQKVETIIAAKQIKPIVLLTPVKENLTMCCICDIWDSRDAIRKHYLDQHFSQELDNDLKEILELALNKCQKCPEKLNSEHLALEHGWLDEILKNTELIDKKRSELVINGNGSIKKRRSSIDLTKKHAKRSKLTNEDFKCSLCNRLLTYRNHSGAVDHFAIHAWIFMQNINQEQQSWINAIMNHLPLKKYLEHHRLSMEDLEARKNILEPMKKIVGDIVSSKWCGICLNTNTNPSDNSNTVNTKCCTKHPKFISQKLKKVEDVESLRNIISPQKSLNAGSDCDEDKEFCDYCIDGFKTLQYYEHMALDHWKEHFENKLVPEYFKKDHKCKKCGFDASNLSLDDKILHIARYHQIVDQIHTKDREDNFREKEFHDIFEEMIVAEQTTKDLKLYRCKECPGMNFYDLRELRLHVKNHLKKSWPLPKTHPYICPECFYEAATYLSLFKHVGTTHGAELKSYYNRMMFQRQQKMLQQQNHLEIPSNASLQIRANYKQPKTFTISAPQVPDKPKITISDELHKLFGDIENCETFEEMDQDQDDSTKELEANIHPPQHVSCHLNHQKQTVPHQWLCGGKLLLLDDPKHENNIKLFQNQWIRGQPVLACKSAELLDKKLWHPEAFLKDFGHLKHDLVNCLTGKTVPKASLHTFWKGFQSIGDRLKDQNGMPMILKLKDWPPTEDIAEYIPVRFKNFVDAFPLPMYTHREGMLNLASYLPDYCLKPELGPKMYIAYGSALYSSKGSTNLHIDMSDAVNCLVYVGFPKDGDPKENQKEVFKEVDKAGCDILMKRRIRDRNVLPGALWHIFQPEDTIKIRDFLNKIAIEKGLRLDPHDDPIHDQSTYLDMHLRTRLYNEYGVKGYAIVQCAGDTVFIPAGAAHQVRNLHNCIKVAEDFVSPENIAHCIRLTEEFRHLTEWHTNHEDVLQIKSILFHAIKNALAVLNRED